MAGYCYLVFFSLLFNQGWAVPMSISCFSPEMLIVEPNSTLELSCASTCGSTSSHEFKWLRTNWMEGGKEKKDQLLEFTGPTMKIKSASYLDGGMYKCHCLPNGPQCMQEVYIQSSMEIISKNDFLYLEREDIAELYCKVRATPGSVKFLTITRSSAMSGPDVKRFTESGHIEVAYLWLEYTNIPREDFTCTVKTYNYEMKMVEMLEKSFTLYRYRFPDVPDSGGAILKLGHPFQIFCLVEISGDVETTVTWSFQGKELRLDSGKYSTLAIEEGEMTIRHVLVVNTAEMSDVGIYICDVHSPYRIEYKHGMKIELSDKGEPEESVRRNQESNTENQESKESKSSVSVMNVACVAVVVCCTLVVVRLLLLRRNNWNRSFHHILYHSSKGGKKF